MSYRHSAEADFGAKGDGFVFVWELHTPQSQAFLVLRVRSRVLRDFNAVQSGQSDCELRHVVQYGILVENQLGAEMRTRCIVSIIRQVDRHERSYSLHNERLAA